MCCFIVEWEAVNETNILKMVSDGTRALTGTQQGKKYTTKRTIIHRNKILRLHFKVSKNTAMTLKCSHFGSCLLRSLWVRCCILLHLPSLAVWNKYRPHNHDWSLHRPTRGQSVSMNTCICMWMCLCVCVHPQWAGRDLVDTVFGKG